MKLIRNAGTDRVLDLIEPQLVPGHRLDLLTPTASIFAFEAIRKGASLLAGARFVLPSGKVDLALQGSEQDRTARNRLQAPRLAKLFAEWCYDPRKFRVIAPAYLSANKAVCPTAI